MKSAFALSLVLASFIPLVARAITIETVPVGNPGNANDIQGPALFGRVTTEYRIAIKEVTNAQYVEFLNSVGASDATGLYNTNMGFTSRGGILRSGTLGAYTYSVKPDVPDGGPGDTNYQYGDKPVVYVSWSDAARFANWMHNGANAGASTETGGYTMLAGVGVTRNGTATWFLPTEDQWYKAAYYDGAASLYYDYPTKSNGQPTNDIPAEETGNSANYFNGSFTQKSDYPFTTVGAYTQSESAYGTFDQGGNVWEWTETFTSATSTRVRRGGAFDTTATALNASNRESIVPTSENESMGFRLATVAAAPPGIPGDYNANNTVDAGDYVLWRKHLGTAVTLPNDSTSGTSPGDYDVWRSNFGKPPGSGASSTGFLGSAVPEPATAILGLLTFIPLSMRRARKS